MSAAENVLSMRKISHRANQIKNIRVNKELKTYKPSKRGVSDEETSACAWLTGIKNAGAIVI